MAKILLNSDELSKYSIIGGDVDTDKVLPAIKAYQETQIRKLLGIELYTKICNDFYDETLTGYYETLYYDYIKPMLIHGSTGIYLRSGAYSVMNGGITKHSSDNNQAVDKNEIDFLVDSANQLAQSYKEDFLDWIDINYIYITEYNKTCKSSNILVGGWVVKRK